MNILMYHGTDPILIWLLMGAMSITAVTLATASLKEPITITSTLITWACGLCGPIASIICVAMFFSGWLKPDLNKEN
jgi:hypothetical protein